MGRNRGRKATTDSSSALVNQQPVASNPEHDSVPNPQAHQSTGSQIVSRDPAQRDRQTRSNVQQKIQRPPEDVRILASQAASPTPASSPLSLNPATSSFVPGRNSQSPAAPPTAPKFKPYQPLRFSNGAREKQVLGQAKDHMPKEQTRGAVRYVGGRFARKNREARTTVTGNADSDTVLPSVEGHDQPGPWLKGMTIEEALQPIRKVSVSRQSHTPPPVPVPIPTQAYMTQANLEPSKLTDSTQKLLIVLDLNGTLLFRKKRTKSVVFETRPGVTIFLDYLFSNHTVMVYTSARPENADIMVRKLMHPKQRLQLVATWGRDKLDLSKAQYNGKVQVYKKLEKIWSDASIQASAADAAASGQKWDQTNTVLIDDSHIKASSQPHNLLQVPEFINDKPPGSEAQKDWYQNQLAVLADLQTRLEELKTHADVSRQIRVWQAETKKLVDDRNIPGLGPAGIADAPPRSPTPAVLSEIDSESDGEHQGGAKVRSQSPIDENVWASILAGQTP